MTDIKTAAWRRPVLWLAVLFAVSRLGFYVAGVRFDLEPLATSWQILDPVLLREQLFTSLFYMPGQPPLYNLILGLVLNTSNNEAVLTVLFRCIYSGMALASVLLLYALLRRLSIHRAASFTIALLFMLTPALILYESIPYYTVPILVLLGAIAWLFHACVSNFTLTRALALFLAMAALIYLRSMFQWQWFVVLVGFCALVLPGYRRHVLLAAVLPLALVLALYAKNAVITGHFATSTWMGMSLSKLTTLAIDRDERERMVEDGKLSRLALNDFPFDTPEAYDHYFEKVEPTGIAVLDQKRKSTGHVNYNHLAYASVSQQALEDAIVSVRTHPQTYLQSMGRAWLMFLRPASDYPFLQDNRGAIEPWSRAFAIGLAGQPSYPENPDFDLRLDEIGLLIAAGYALAVGFGLWLLLRCAWRRRVSTADATLIFLWLNIMYVSVIGNAFEVGENQRFRFAINPFIATMLAVMAQRALDRLRGRYDPRAGSSLRTIAE